MENNEETIVTKEKKKSKVWLAILINILTVMLAAGGVYYYFEYIDKDEIETIEEEKEEVLNNQSNIVNLVEIENLINKYDYYVSNETEVITQLYKLDTNNYTTFNRIYFDMTVIKEINKVEKNFTLEEYKNGITKLYGETVALEIIPQDIKTMYREEVTSYTYDENSGDFTYVGAGIGGTYPMTLERKILNIEETANILKVEVAIAKCDNATGTSICTTTNSETPLPGINGFTEFNIDTQYDQANKYIYAFNYDEKLDNYYLASISKK